jgi:hypothetical protein
MGAYAAVKNRSWKLVSRKVLKRFCKVMSELNKWWVMF